MNEDDISSAQWSWCIMNADYDLTQDSQYPGHKGDLWDVYCEYLDKTSRVITGPRCILRMEEKNTDSNVDWTLHGHSHEIK